MHKKFIESQYNSIEKVVRMCLKRQDYNSVKSKNPEVLSSLIALSYIGLIAKAIEGNSLTDIEKNEKAIDDMVEIFLKDIKLKNVTGE